MAAASARAQPRPLPAHIPSRGAPTATHAWPHGAAGDALTWGPCPRCCHQRGASMGSLAWLLPAPCGASCPWPRHPPRSVPGTGCSPTAPSPTPVGARRWVQPHGPITHPSWRWVQPCVVPSSLCPPQAPAPHRRAPSPGTPAHQQPQRLEGSSYYFLFKTIIIFTFHLFFFRLFLLLAMYRLLQGVPTPGGAPCPGRAWHRRCARGQGRRAGGEAGSGAELNEANSVKAAGTPAPGRCHPAEPPPQPPRLCRQACPGHGWGTKASPSSIESHGDGGMAAGRDS